MIRKLSFSESHSILQSGERVALLDVREEPEYITGHVAGAELLPVDEITAETAAELIPSYDTPVLVYCRSGMRSARRHACWKSWDTGTSATWADLPAGRTDWNKEESSMKTTKSMTRNPGRAADPRVLSPGRTCRLETEAE